MFSSHQAISKHRKKYHRDGLPYSGGSGYRVRKVVTQCL